MDDLAREIASLRDELTPAWDEARSERLYDGVGRLQRRRRRQRLIAGSGLGAALVLGAVLGVQNLPGDSGLVARSAGNLGASQPLAAAPRAAAPQPTASAARVSARQRVRLADGSSALVSSAVGTLDVLRNEPAHLELALRSGTAHFEVVPNKVRKFVVTAGSVQVHVVGTVFDVEQGDERVRVAVSEGKVRVETPTGTQFVRGGESAWFDTTGARLSDDAEPAADREATLIPSSDPSHATADTKAPPVRGAETLAESAPRSAREHAVNTMKSKRLAAKEDKTVIAPKVSWRSLCQSGDYDAAYRMLEGGTVVENDPAALMDAADAARLSNHPDASVSYLRRVLREHSRSPVAPLAGFTLGRVLLERLGQPAEAAEAFALARSISPQGSLAQDALAREVEAWSKAGNSHEAYERAQLYVQLYPSGRRLRAVRLYGGLE
ncbi:MAG TPA: FecR family protein [Polyangiales bacterium]|nr:FecR family protein [Polyangiales bacterium]